MHGASAEDEVGRIEEQIVYYRELAPAYDQLGLKEWRAAGEELEAALEAFAADGRVLELACGTGIWTERLTRSARSLTAVDSSPEMLALAGRRVGEGRVRFIEADIFGWEPEGRYDAVVFCFWLSHVPMERFEEFWSLVGRCLEPGGRVFFADDGLREAEELVEGLDSSTVLRRLGDGSSRRIYKVPHEPAELQQRLAQLGWRIEVRQTSGPFYLGQGSRA
jgi:demethylmenaquinone methyltransferase/2-methoxy-6-polyprenyl-1,4-benzoquinol methylase